MKRNNIHKLDLFCVTILVLEIVSATARGDSGGCGAAAVKGGTATLWAASSRAQFACDPGSQLLGAASSSCVGGRWQPPAPVCVKPGCSAIVDVPNGVIYEQSHRGAVVKFRCRPGYNSNTFPVVYCNGLKWNYTRLECNADREASRTRCDFEPEDLCGWARGAPEGGYSWRRRSSSTPSRAAGTGPLFDHTLGPGRHGHYLYIESSTGNEGDTASLYSPVFSPALSNHSCVYFWYHMYGATTGSLRVYVRPESAGQDLRPVFQLDGHQEDAWLLGFFPLNGTDEPFQIVFEGVHGHGYTSDIAIDDFKLTNGSCSAHVASNIFEKGGRRARRAGESWSAGAVAAAAAAAVGAALLAAGGAALAWRRWAGAAGGHVEAAPDDAYVRYMSHEEALVQDDDSDASEGLGVL